MKNLVEDGFCEERAELEAVLASDTFTRSPNLGQLLRYICQQYFSGDGNKIKEYNIAVEALGRPASFDPRRDSIVRVEASRLRRRLQELYKTVYAGHPIQITIPSGSYTPQFVRTDEVAGPGGVPFKAASWRRVLYAVAILSLLVAFALFFRGRLGWDRSSGAASARAAVAADPPPGWAGDEVRILAGSNAAKFVDCFGNSWSPDRYYTGGRAAGVPPRPIAKTRDDTIYHHWRQGPSSYDIPLKKGVYELRLHFAETLFGENNDLGGGEWSRIFSVFANGKVLLDSLDVLADAGGTNTADIKVFKDIQPAADGYLHLRFVSVRESSFINAIEVLPSKPGAIRPVRIVARDSNYTDEHDVTWSADRYFHNGTLVQRHDSIKGTTQPALYQNERFGNFTYTLPVALNSRYSVTLRFCEYWFGRHNIGGGDGGVGSRVFDVHLNGRTLLRDFDVFKEAGSLHALDRTFRRVEPNAQGKLIFSFVPVRNYAMINAIEVVDEAWK